MRLRAESDPLAELARLIGQTDPFASTRPRQSGGARRAPAARAAVSAARDRARVTIPPPGRRPGCSAPIARQEACRRRITPQDTPTIIRRRTIRARSIRCAAMRPSIADAGARITISAAAVSAEADQHARSVALRRCAVRPARCRRSRTTSTSRPIRTIPYAYQDGYDEAAEEHAPKRRGGMTTVLAVLALAVVGTGGAFAYRHLCRSPRSGEPPIIKADTARPRSCRRPPTAAAKVPDRLLGGDGSEKIVPREETPVDVNASIGSSAAPRWCFRR